MKTRILYLSLFLCSISVTSYSQTSQRSLASAERKDSVGLKYYPLFGSGKDYEVNNFSLWYRARIAEPVTLGTEYSGCFYFTDYPWIESYGVSLALYTGRSFSFDIRNHGFAENSPLYQTYNDKRMEHKYSDTFIFFVPGISLFSKNRKLSLDLCKQLDTQIFVTGKQQIATYKVNFHF